MTWDVPNWYTLVLLALAAFRVFRLIAEDAVLDRPREAIVRRLPKGEEFITCPWCCGFYLSVGVWLLWIWQPHWTLVGCTPFALNAVVGLIASNLDPD